MGQSKLDLISLASQKALAENALAKTLA